MDRPYVVCHMLASLDGKIDGAFMSDPACTSALREYGSLRNEYNCPATLYGTTTMKGGFSAGLAPAGLPESPHFPREDYIAFSEVQNYIVSLDPKGILGWDSGYIEKKGRPKAHVIEALTEQVSGAYLAYLRRFNISHLFAGEKEIDCGLLLEKLKNGFGIEKLMLAGGGYANWSFVQAGCVDELSLVLAPVADGNPNSASFFEKAEFLPTAAKAFSLQEAKVLEGGAVWLRYYMK